MRNKKTLEILKKVEEFIDNYDEGCIMNISYTEALIIDHYIKYLESLINVYDNILKKESD